MSELEDIWHKQINDIIKLRRKHMSADPELYRDTCPICLGLHSESECEVKDIDK
jgi:hypothetical protein